MYVDARTNVCLGLGQKTIHKLFPPLLFIQIYICTYTYIHTYIRYVYVKESLKNVDKNID